MEPEGLALGEAAALGAAGEALGTEVALGVVVGAMEALDPAETVDSGVAVVASVGVDVTRTDDEADASATRLVAGDVESPGVGDAPAPVVTSEFPPRSTRKISVAVAMNAATKPASHVARGARKPASIAGTSGG